jgi:hypothetical protein
MSVNRGEAVHHSDFGRRGDGNRQDARSAKDRQGQEEVFDRIYRIDRMIRNPVDPVDPV